MNRKIVIGVTAILIIAIFYLFRLDLRLRYFLKTYDVIIYGNNVHVEDFKLKENWGNSDILYTHGFGCIYNVGPIPIAECFSYFEPKKSWIKKPLDDNIKLDFKFHEIIFKLNELHARKLEATLKNHLNKNEPLSYEDFLIEYEKMKMKNNSLKSKIENEDYITYAQKVEKWTLWIDNELEYYHK